MASQLQPRSIRNIGIYGVIRPAEVDDSLIPDGAVTDVMNFHFDRKGAATVRPGLTALGSTVLADRPSVGIHNAQSGTALVVFSNGGSSAIYSYDGSSWSVSLDGGTASVRVRFVDFGSYTIALNFAYDTYSSMRFWNAGSSRHWHHTGNPINPQHMYGYTPQVGEVYKSRVYLSGDTSVEGNSSRLFFSSVISTAGIITWSPTLDFVDINPGDGEDITALKRYSTELLVFKPNYTYRFRTSGTDPDPLIKVGTRSQESVVEGKRGLYFHDEKGFMRYTGGYPDDVSRAISDIVDAIPFSQHDDIIGWNDKDHVYWSIGNVTITESGLSETYTNTVVRLTESSDIWTIYSYPQDIRSAMTYKSSTDLTRIVALDSGVVATQNSGTTDLEEPIEYRLRTNWETWGSEALAKSIQMILVMMEKSVGASIWYQIDENPSWDEIGQMKKMVNFFNTRIKHFNRIRFRIAGITRYEASVFKGIDIVEGINHGIIKG